MTDLRMPLVIDRGVRGSKLYITELHVKAQIWRLVPSISEYPGGNSALILNVLSIVTAQGFIALLDDLVKTIKWPQQ